jgi:diguanylate cyclase (GGDEF)-like protein
VAEPAALTQRAWELSYLDPLAARDIGRRLIEAGEPSTAEGWLHVALAEVRVGDAIIAGDALRRARAAFTSMQDARGLAWCDEIHSIALRRAGDYAGSARLQAQIDAQGAAELGPMYEFVSHNSRAITAKLQGQNDDALRHFYAASDAASRTGWVGPRVIALSNLGGFHQALYNVDDARQLSEEALAAAREGGVRQAIATAASNLIMTYHAAGNMRQARAMAEFLVTHENELVPGVLSRYALPVALGHLGVGEVDSALTYLQSGAVAAVGDGDGQTLWAWLKARCLLARHDAPAARDVAERTLRTRRELRLKDEPYETMQLYRVLADACEQVGDFGAALAFMREAHAHYEALVGRSARARFIALEVTHQLAQAQRERDRAVDSHRSVEDDRRRLTDLNAALQEQAAQNELLHVKLREQALRDPLTGLHNRRYLFEMAPGLLELARRQASPLCVVLIDLDHFKLLNDTYGHHAGDLVLQRFARLMTQMLRRSDVICRHGGEEFVAVMPDIDVDGAQAVLNRLLEAFQVQQPSEVGRRRLPGGSFSAGIALFPRHGNTLEQLLTRADRGLYAAKNHGRARIEPAPRTGFGTLT